MGEVGCRFPSILRVSIANPLDEILGLAAVESLVQDPLNFELWLIVDDVRWRTRRNIAIRVEGGGIRIRTQAWYMEGGVKAKGSREFQFVRHLANAFKDCIRSKKTRGKLLGRSTDLIGGSDVERGEKYSISRGEGEVRAVLVC
jgi:hypothetical protein